MKKILNMKPVVSLGLIAFIVSLGVMTGMIIAPTMAQSTYASIGYVDVEQAIESHPDLQNVMTAIQAFEDAKFAELADQYGDMSSISDTDRQQLMNDLYQVQSEIDNEKQRLTEPLIQDVLDVTAEIGEESGIEVILEAGSVMWGGLNMTPLVVARLATS